MAKGKKEKVVSIKPETQEKLWVFPAGDPRNDMTQAELEAAAKAEEEEITARLSKLPPKPEEDEDVEDEEEEIFNVDLENKIITQETFSGLVLTSETEGVQKLNLNAEPTPLISIDPLAVIVNQVIVKKALHALMGEISEQINTIDTMTWKHAATSRELSDLIETLQDKISAIRSAISPLDGSVHYDKIPTWARSYVENTVTKKIQALFDFAE